MVDIYGRLNARQLEVLRWICDGCPDGIMVGFTCKATAIALQNRRLVRVSKKGGQWRAEATDAGRYYLEHGHHPRRPASAARRGGYRVASASAALEAPKNKKQTFRVKTAGRGRAARRRRRRRVRRVQWAALAADQVGQVWRCGIA